MNMLRILSFLPLLIIIIISCKNNPSISNLGSNDIKINLSQKIIQHQIQKITYIATTRGFYEKIEISLDSVTIINVRDGKNARSMPYTVDKWNHILKAVIEIGLINIETFEAPTQMYQVDGAAMAHIEIKTQDSVYRSQIFDNGHPPIELSAIYKAIQTVKESTVKQ